MQNKTERLREAIIKFRKSDQEVHDYMSLFIVVHAVLRQGSGLLWSDVNEVLAEEIGYEFTLCPLDNNCEICGKEGGH